MLDNAKVENEKEARKKFVLISNPRSGSYYFSCLLNIHPEVLMYDEYFNPINIAANYNHFSAPHSLFEKDPIRYLDYFWKAQDFPNAQRPVRGFKVFRTQQAQVVDALLHDVSVKKIILQRENNLKQYVSFQRALSTGVWHRGMRKTNIAVLKQLYALFFYAAHFNFKGIRLHFQNNFRRISGAKYASKPLLINPDEFLRFTKDIESSSKYFEEIEQATGQDYFWINYEGLNSAQRDNKVKAAWHFLGVPDWNGEIYTRMQKQGKMPLRESIANYDEVATSLKGTEYEWMLED